MTKQLLFILVLPLLLLTALLLLDFFPVGWSNRFGGASNILGFFTVYLSYIYVVLTNQMLRQMIKSQEADRRPFVIVDIERTQGWGYMVVKNIGKLPARDLSITFNPPIRAIFGQTERPISLIENPIPFLPPERELRTAIGLEQLIFRGPNVRPYAVIVSYSWSGHNTPVSEEYSIDVAVYGRMLDLRDTRPQG
jgi:hypothetical protein